MNSLKENGKTLVYLFVLAALLPVLYPELIGVIADSVALQLENGDVLHRVVQEMKLMLKSGMEQSNLLIG